MKPVAKKTGAMDAITLAPAGRLRAAINRANPVLSTIDAATGGPGGVAVDISRELGRRLGVPTDLIVYGSARECVQAIGSSQADIGYFAIDPLRAGDLHFTPPYVLMEGVYAVPAHSAIQRIEDVDRPGHRIAVGAGSAYALFLARNMKNAKVVDVATSPEVVETFVRQRLEVAAGVRQQMQKDMAQFPGVRLVAERFMAIHQAMAVKKCAGDAAFTYLNEFIEDLKASGFIADAFARHAIAGASVAPPGYPESD
jgi:polar amino acid transport system substrate-binding protein